MGLSGSPRSALGLLRRGSADVLTCRLFSCCALQAFSDTSVSIEPRQEPTGLPLATLQWVGRSIATVPKGFSLHPEVQRMLDARRRGPALLACSISQLSSRLLCRQLHHFGCVHLSRLLKPYVELCSNCACDGTT